MNNLFNIIYMIFSLVENRINIINLLKKVINRIFVLNLYFIFCFIKMVYIGFY